MDGSLEQIIAALYDSDAKSRWESVERSFGSFMGATTLGALAISSITRDVIFSFSKWPEAVRSEYTDRYLDSDPRMAAATRAMGRTLACVETTDPREFEKSALVCDFLDRPEVDARWGIVHLSPSDDGHFLFVVGGSRRRAAGPFLEADKARFDLVVPHIKRAFEFDSRVAALDRDKRALEDTLDAVHDAVIVVSGDLRVYHVNAKAAALVGEGRGLRMSSGRLYATGAAEHALLGRAVAAAAANDATTAHTATIRQSDGPPILVRAYRLPRFAEGAGGRELRQCALILSGGGGNIDAGVNAMMAAFGLTAAEQKLVRRLLQGVSLMAYAKEASVSIETVRSQLKSAHEKVGVRRQADLVRILTQYLQ